MNSSDALIQEHYAKEVSTSIGPVSICTCRGSSSGRRCRRKQQTVQLSLQDCSWAVLLISTVTAEAYAAERLACASPVHARLLPSMPLLEHRSSCVLQAHETQQLYWGRRHVCG